MLTRRQSEILIELYASQDRFITASELGEDHQVSLRSVQNDIAALKNSLHDSGARLNTTNSKGCQLVIADSSRFGEFLSGVRDNYERSYTFNEQQTRLIYIMSKLLGSEGYVRSTKLADELYISRSRLTADLKQVRETLQRYNIELLSRPAWGLKIRGGEADIRQCMIKENINVVKLAPASIPDSVKADNNMNKVKNIVTEILINSQFVVSDIVFQNLIVHVLTSLDRMKSGHYVQDDAFQLDPSFKHVQEIAAEIMKQCCRIYDIKFSKGEADLLALNIQGKREFSNQEYISKEINDFIFQTLVIIKNRFHIDFANDVNLRISLALHTFPLITRINSNMQLKNLMTYEIKQKYVMAFDIASVYSYELTKKYGAKVTDDEVSFIALHFGAAMEKRNHTGSRKILLISSEKKSNTILVRQKFDQWFKADIDVFDIINPSQIEPGLFKRYDAVFTTDSAIADSYNAVLISFFLNDSDYQRIELAMNGFRSPSDITNKFDEDIFFCQDLETKDETIKLLCSSAEDKFCLNKDLYNAVINHENVANSYFGHLIAMPHPDNLVTNNTFIGVCILKHPITWEGEEKARIVFLVSIEKNNPKAFNLWYYLSFLISNQKAIESIIRKPTYDNFMKVIGDLYDKIFSNSDEIR